MYSADKQNITAVILAGGKARRMNGNDKGLMQLNNKPLIAYILEKLKPQVGQIIINANRNLVEYAKFNYPIISDKLSGFCGPLAGIAAAMEYCKSGYLVSVPCDSPFIPDNLTMRLYNDMSRNDTATDIAIVNSGNHMQPTFCLVKVCLLASLQDYLNLGGRKIDQWFKQHSYVEVNFMDKSQTFMNINTPKDLAEAEKLLKRS